MEELIDKKLPFNCGNTEISISTKQTLFLLISSSNNIFDLNHIINISKNHKTDIDSIDVSDHDNTQNFIDDKIKPLTQEQKEKLFLIKEFVFLRDDLGEKDGSVYMILKENNIIFCRFSTRNDANFTSTTYFLPENITILSGDFDIFNFIENIKKQIINKIFVPSQEYNVFPSFWFDFKLEKIKDNISENIENIYVLKYKNVVISVITKTVINGINNYSIMLSSVISDIGIKLKLE